MRPLGNTLLPMFAATLASTILLAPVGASALAGPVSAPVSAPVSDPGNGAHHGLGHGHATDEPVIVGHRGASGYRPEHTLASYRLAVRLGADYIEPDLVSTKDGVLVARHENDITSTTDVADHPEFADRKATKSIDGTSITGWFTEDFTLAELKTLRAKERLPEVRPDNTRYDGRFEVPTLDEVFDMVREESKRTHRKIGVAPETKHPTYFDSLGLSLEEPLVGALKAHHLNGGKSKVIIQSFEIENLRELDTMTRVPLAQLMDASGAPYDSAKPANLEQIATYADILGAEKSLVLPQDAEGATGDPSPLVDDAHATGLDVHVWTLRDENQFMATNFRIGDDPDAKGDSHAETTAFLDAGVDGVFTDYSDTTFDARADWLAGQ